MSSTGWKHGGILRQNYPPSLSKFGELRSRTKADLLWCFKDTYPPPTYAIPDVEVILLDGAAVINILKPGSAKTFSEYSELVFLPFVQSQLQKDNRVDIIWDEYIPDSLKATARQKRGKGTRRRVQPNTKIPGNWQAFLRIDENKVELFAFLAQESVKIQCEGKIVSTFGKLILLNTPDADTSRLYPCTHEEADTTLLMQQLMDATALCYVLWTQMWLSCVLHYLEKVYFRSIHSSSVWRNKTLTLTLTLTLIHRAIEAHVGPKVHFIPLFIQINLTELWILFGTGKTRRFIPANHNSTYSWSSESNVLAYVACIYRMRPDIISF